MHKLMLIYILLARSLTRQLDHCELPLIIDAGICIVVAAAHGILFPCFVYDMRSLCAKWFCSFAEFSNENNSNMCAQFSTKQSVFKLFSMLVCALFFGRCCDLFLLRLWLLLWLFCYFFYPAFLDYFNIRVYRICKRFRAQTHTHTLANAAQQKRYQCEERTKKTNHTLETNQ